MNAKTIAHIAAPARRSLSESFSVNQVSSPGPHDLLDPILSIDSFVISQPFFRPHPHAGFSAVTYLLPASVGGITNRDSLGNFNLIEGGAIHWSAAGSGMVHEEVPTRPGEPVVGLQIFANLPAERKLAPPQMFHLDGADVPRVEGSRTTTHVVAGSHDGVRSPLDLPIAVTLLTIEMGPHSTWRHRSAEGESRVMLVMSGTVTIPDRAAVAENLGIDHTAFFSNLGTDIEVVNHADDPAVVVVIGGTPLREPIVFEGPFAMNTSAQVADAHRRYRAGDMGNMTASF